MDNLFYSEVEQLGVLVGLITRRSKVQILSSLLNQTTHTSSLHHENKHLDSSKTNESYDQNNLQNILFYGHKNNKVKFNEWLVSKKLSKGYINSLNSVLENTLKLKFTNPLELRDALGKVKNRKYRALALRNLFNFFEEYEILDENLLLKLKSKIRITERSNIDHFIPSDEQIKDFLGLLKDYDENGFLFAQILLESGLRVSEVQYFVNNLDKTKFEVIGDVVIYPLYYRRGTKNSYYMFMRKQTYLQILERYNSFKGFNVEKLKTWIKRNNQISLKYTRKHNFTKLIRSGISLEVANFIQGRVSSNIGFNHYLAKKEIALKEYLKISSL